MSLVLFISRLRLRESLTSITVLAAKKVLPRLAIAYLTLGIKAARYIESTMSKWSELS